MSGWLFIFTLFSYVSLCLSDVGCGSVFCVGCLNALCSGSICGAVAVMWRADGVLGGFFCVRLSFLDVVVLSSLVGWSCFFMFSGIPDIL